MQSESETLSIGEPMNPKITAIYNQQTDQVLIIIDGENKHTNLTREQAQRFAAELDYALATKPKKDPWGKLIPVEAHNP
jgi:hypothetical protein